MSVDQPRNLAASVRQRLYNLAKEKNEDFNFVLGRFVAERILFRLSVSEHASNFVLKGALLFLLWSDRPPRYVALAEEPIAAPGQRVMLGGYPVRGEERDGRAAARFKGGTILGIEGRRVSGARVAVATRRTIVSLKIDAIADAGQSGGPLLVAGTFAAAGVIRANLERETGGLERRQPPEGGAVAVPMLYVRPFLDRYR